MNFIETELAVPHYDDPNIPLRIKYYKKVKNDYGTLPHWHDDYELVYLLKGQYEYRINDDKLILQPGDFLFINSKVLHYDLAMTDSIETYMIVFQPSILTGNKTIFDTFLKPIQGINPIEYLYFPRNTPQSEECGKWVKKIEHLYTEHKHSYYLTAIAYLIFIMNVIIEEFANRNPAFKQITPMGEMEKKMITYIYEHFSEKITLNDIANSANINTHTCCDIFKHYLNTSPIAYLNSFRLDMSTRLLTNSKASVQYISYSCGFDSSAYFIKLFKERYGITPIQYRKQMSERKSNGKIQN